MHSTFEQSGYLTLACAFSAFFLAAASAFNNFFRAFLDRGCPFSSNRTSSTPLAAAVTSCSDMVEVMIDDGAKKIKCGELGVRELGGRRVGGGQRTDANQRVEVKIIIQY